MIVTQTVILLETFFGVKTASWQLSAEYNAWIWFSRCKNSSKIAETSFRRLVKNQQKLFSGKIDFVKVSLLEKLSVKSHSQKCFAQTNAQNVKHSKRCVLLTNKILLVLEH